MISMEPWLQRITPEHDKLVVCVALLGSTPIIGWNSTKTSPAWMRKYENGDISFTRHAELHCLDQIPHDANRQRIKLYVSRLSKTGRMAMAKPCPACQLALKEAGIKKIYYTDWDGNWRRLHA